MGLADLFGSVSAGLGGADSLANYQLAQQKINAAQMQNQTQQSVLQALAAARQQGNTNPTQILGTLATIDPQYAEKAAQIQAQNPLASILQGSQGAQGQTPAANLSGDDLLKALPPQIGTQ